MILFIIKQLIFKIICNLNYFIGGIRFFELKREDSYKGNFVVIYEFLFFRLSIFLVMRKEFLLDEGDFG